MPRSRPAGLAVRSACTAGLLALGVLATWVPGLAQSDPPAKVAAGPTPTLSYPLEGTRWRAVSAVVAGDERSIAPDITAWFRLGDGRLTGSTGCGRVRGAYRIGADVPVEPAPPALAPSPALSPGLGASSSTQPSAGLPVDARLAFGRMAPRGEDCAEQSFVAATAIVAGLERTASFRLEPSSPAWETGLELLDATGSPVLRFRVDDAGPLTGITWLLDAVDGRPALPSIDGQPAILVFDDPIRGDTASQARRVAGSTGCDAFSATYAVTGNVLSVGEVTTSDVECPPSLTTQAEAIVEILSASSLRVSLPPGALVLASDDDARTLRYRRAAPLEDQTWVIEPREGAALGEDRVVTLLLAVNPGSTSGTASERTGAVSGEGPCRPYTAGFRTDGLRVAFDAVRAGDGACADRRAERRFLRALRRAVFAESDGGRMRLRDGQGRLLLTFALPGLP